MPAQYVGPTAKETRKAVRALVAAFYSASPAEPNRRLRLARLALEAYDVATEYDNGLWLSSQDYEALRAVALGGVK